MACFYNYVSQQPFNFNRCLSRLIVTAVDLEGVHAVAVIWNR